MKNIDRDIAQLLIELIEEAKKAAKAPHEVADLNAFYCERLKKEIKK